MGWRRPDPGPVPATDPALLAERFVELADTLGEDFDLIEFLYGLVEGCCDLLDISAVGLMLGDAHSRLHVMTSSSDETRVLELFQLQIDQGPCLECYRSSEPVHEGNLATATLRWPLFAPAAVAAGYRTVHALPMRLRERTVGSLNLFHSEAGALGEDVTRIAQALVDVATIGLIHVQMNRRENVLADQLEAALEARIVIEQAKGVFAEQHSVDPRAALALMRNHAQVRQESLSDFAYAMTRGCDVARAHTPTD